MLSLVGMLACNTITGSGDPVGDPLDDLDLDDPDGPGGDDDDDDEATVPASERPLAGDVQIAKVSLFQGVETVLVEAGARPNRMQMPMVADRPGQLRVFLDPDPGFQPRRLTALLEIVTDGGSETLEVTKRITGPSRIEDPYTTINFDLEGDQLPESTNFVLEIREGAADGPGGGTRRTATWDSAARGGLDIETTDELRVVVIPVRYGADGSNRMPDTSAAQLQRYEDLMMGMFPATNVVIEVGPTFPWNRPIGATDSGQWADILEEMNRLRDDANEPPNTYYYGVFEPSNSIYSFCGGGCIAGMSLLAYSANDPYFRASVGIGFTGDVAAETMVHEIGHAHGRDHAPCGVLGDRDYPYPNARLGVWGYSVVTGESFSPDTHVDVMSYCSPTWISDYNMYFLSQRMKTVARQRLASPTPRTAMRVIDGVATPTRPIAIASTDGAPQAEVQLFDAEGNPAGSATAAFFPYSHAEGGVIAFDEELPAGWTAEVVSLPERL